MKIGEDILGIGIDVIDVGDRVTLGKLKFEAQDKIYYGTKIIHQTIHTNNV